MVTPRDKRSDLPFDAAVNFNGELDGAVGLVLGEGEAVVGGDRDVVAVEKGGPDVDVLVALVDGRDDGVVGNLLAVVGGEGVEFVVVDADAGVGVAGEDGDLEGGGDDVGSGDVEGEDGGVLEEEPGLFGLEDGPHQEDDQEEEEVEHQEGCAAFAEDLPPLALVVAAHFLRRHLFRALFFLTGDVCVCMCLVILMR